MYSYTYSDKAVFLQLWRLRGTLKFTVFIDETVNVTGSVNLIHTDVDPLHALQVGRSSVGQNSEEIPSVHIYYSGTSLVWGRGGVREVLGRSAYSLKVS